MADGGRCDLAIEAADTMTHVEDHASFPGIHVDHVDHQWQAERVGGLARQAQGRCRVVPHHLVTEADGRA